MPEENEKFEAYLKDLFEKKSISHVYGKWEEERIKSKGAELFSCVFPLEEGAPTIVFIPGTSIYALCYAELLYSLYEKGFNVVSFDPRGQGRSTGVPGDYTIMEHVEDAKAAARYARERFKGKVFVMGSSQGGIEAFYLAATPDPEADGVICHNIADLPSSESIRLTRFGPPNRMTALHGLMSRLMVPFMNFAGSVMPGLRVPIPFYLDLKAEKMEPYGDAWTFIKEDPLALTSITMRAFSSIATTPLPRPPEEIDIPVLVLHSTGDEIFPEDYVRSLYERLTCDKEIKVYEGLPHLITIEYVDRIVPGVALWVDARS